MSNPRADPLREGKARKGGLNREYQIPQNQRPPDPPPQRPPDAMSLDPLWVPLSIRGHAGAEEFYRRTQEAWAALLDDRDRLRDRLDESAARYLAQGVELDDLRSLVAERDSEIVGLMRQVDRLQAAKHGKG